MSTGIYDPAIYDPAIYDTGAPIVVLTGFLPRDSVARFTMPTLPTASISVPSMETSVVVPGLPEGTVE